MSALECSLAPRDVERLVSKAFEKPRNLSTKEIAGLLSLVGAQERAILRNAAREMKRHYFGRMVAIRGIVEIGNVCSKDCYYCGIRKSNCSVKRYRLSVGDVERMVAGCAALGYKSAVLQGGEIESEANTEFIENVLAAIAKYDLGVTLSLGEQRKDVLRRWKDAGALRYLLRIETSDPDLYSSIHPPECSWQRRVQCLHDLRECGYLVGTGTMSSLPRQTAGNLARDIVFFGDVDADMIGMGPYIAHHETPLAKYDEVACTVKLERALDMISVTRLYLHDVNIASTTALEALAPDGRERGVLAGANVVMPNATDVETRPSYQLYPGKPGLDEASSEANSRLCASMERIGEEIDFLTRGDSPKAKRRIEKGI